MNKKTLLLLALLLLGALGVSAGASAGIGTSPSKCHFLCR